MKNLIKYIISLIYDNALLPDDCCLLPNQIMIPQLHQGNSITAIATPVLFYQNFPLQVKKFFSTFSFTIKNF